MFRKLYGIIACILALSIFITANPAMIAFAVGETTTAVESGVNDAAAIYDMDVVEALAAQTTVTTLKAKASILIDAATGVILLEGNKDAKLPIASMTKIMSMLLIMEAIDSGKLKFDDVLTTSNHAYSMGGSQAYMPPGEKNTVTDLLKAVAIHSANDATVVLAEAIGGSEDGFVTLMNTKAATLGMKNTHFLDSTGLTEDLNGEKSYSTANDVAIMARELILKHPKILEFTSIWHDTFRNGEFSLDNTNKLIHSHKWIDGLKTGFTDAAGYNLTATGVKNNMRVISVVMGEETTNLRFAETIKLLEYGIGNYESALTGKQNDVMGQATVKKGVKTSVNALLEKDAYIVYKKIDKEKISKTVVMDENLTAPIQQGQKVGEVIYKVGDQEIIRVNLVSEIEDKKANFLVLFFRMLGDWIVFWK